MSEKRCCKSCANFDWAGTSPTAKAAYQAYIVSKSDHEARQNQPEPTGFWAKFWKALELFAPLQHYHERPPFPAPNPDLYGWCRLNPVAVEKGVNGWCSHFKASK